MTWWGALREVVGKWRLWIPRCARNDMVGGRRVGGRYGRWLGNGGLGFLAALGMTWWDGLGGVTGGGWEMEALDSSLRSE